METRYKFLGGRTITKVGNSLGTPIPTEGLKELGLKKGDRVVVYLDKENKEIRLVSTKKIYMGKEESDVKIGFELSVPKDIYEKLMKDEDTP